MFHQHTLQEEEMSEEEMSEEEMSEEEMSEEEMSEEEMSEEEMSEEEMSRFLESEGLLDSLNSVRESLLNTARRARKKVNSGKDKHKTFLETMKHDSEFVHKIIQRYIGQVDIADGTISRFAIGSKIYKLYFVGKADSDVWTDFQAWSGAQQWLPTTTIEVVIKLYAMMKTHTKKSNKELNIGHPKKAVPKKAAVILGVDHVESKESSHVSTVTGASKDAAVPVASKDPVGDSGASKDAAVPVASKDADVPVASKNADVTVASKDPVGGSGASKDTTVPVVTAVNSGTSKGLVSTVPVDATLGTVGSTVGQNIKTKESK